MDGSLKSVKIPAPSSQRGRFGISVESIGDVDRDGYNGKLKMSTKVKLLICCYRCCNSGTIGGGAAS